MKIKAILIALCFWMVGTVSFSAYSTTIFKDSSKTGGMLAINVEGSRWIDNSWTPIVSGTEEIYGVDDTPRTKVNATAFPGKDWTPHSGSYSIRFWYSAASKL